MPTPYTEQRLAEAKIAREYAEANRAQAEAEAAKVGQAAAEAMTAYFQKLSAAIDGSES